MPFDRAGGPGAASPALTGLLAVAAALAVLSASPGIVSEPQRAAPLAVMTFNIRYGTASDGLNRWANRRDFLTEVIAAESADLIGLQEALAFQVDEILGALPSYASVGVGRDDGRRVGEFAAILFKRDRFSVADAGTFWLSDTPEVVASKSWGNTITRICTWARLVDRDGRALWLYNVHLDHQSQPSRERSTELLLRRIDARARPAEPVLVTGDFNAGESNPAVTHLTKGHGVTPPRFVDTFRVLHPVATDVGTFTGFTFGLLSGEKIDYVLVEPGVDILDARIVRSQRSGRYPSDHFPVVATVRLK